jgi:TolB-like protein
MHYKKLQLNKHLRIYTLLFFFQIILGCASTPYDKAKTALKQQNPAKAAVYLKDVLENDIFNVTAIRDLGVAFYLMNEFELANQFLIKAYNRSPADRITVYYLGLLYEKVHNKQKSIELYETHSIRSPETALDYDIENRLWALLQQQKNEKIKKLALKHGLERVSPNTIAVIYFVTDNTNEKGKLLREGLLDLLINDLTRAEGLTVADRLSILFIKNHLNIRDAELALPKTAKRFGHILHSRFVIQGALYLENKTVKIQPVITDIKNGKRIHLSIITGPIKDFFQMEEKLLVLISEYLRPMTDENSVSIKRRDLAIDLFFNYCQGLLQEKKGNWSLALKIYRNIVKKEPDMILAKKAVRRMEAWRLVKNVQPSFSYILERNQIPYEKASGFQTITALARTELSDRLHRTSSQINRGLSPGIDSRKPTTETQAHALGTTIPIYVRVPLPVN